MISSMNEYFEQGIAGKHLQEKFREAISEKKFLLDDRLLNGFNFKQDSIGNVINQEHPDYELSQAIKLFSEGSTTSFTNGNYKEGERLREYFIERGKHFVAGYLINHSSGIHQKDKFYLTAMNVWEELNTKK